MADRYPYGGWVPVGTSFVGSFRECPDEMVIVLRGGIDAAAVRSLDRDVADALTARARRVTVEAAAVDSYDPDLLDLLARLQQRLDRGLLRVHGLHPALLCRRSATATDPAPGTRNLVLRPVQDTRA